MDQQTLAAIERWIDQHAEEYIEDVQAFCRIPSVSRADLAQPGAPFGPDCRRALAVLASARLRWPPARAPPPAPAPHPSAAGHPLPQSPFLDLFRLAEETEGPRFPDLEGDGVDILDQDGLCRERPEGETERQRNGCEAAEGGGMEELLHGVSSFFRRERDVFFRLKRLNGSKGYQAGWSVRWP